MNKVLLFFIIVIIGSLSIGFVTGYNLSINLRETVIEKVEVASQCPIAYEEKECPELALKDHLSLNAFNNLRSDLANCEWEHNIQLSKIEELNAAIKGKDEAMLICMNQ